MSFYCKNCRKQLEEFEGNFLPTFRAPTPEFNIPTGGFERWCDECYRIFNIENKIYQTPEVKTKDYSSKINAVLNQEIIDEYYNLKLQLNSLQKREEELKELIKNSMIENKTLNIVSDKIELNCIISYRINYPKKKVEELVPIEILNQIKVIKKTITLFSKIKK